MHFHVPAEKHRKISVVSGRSSSRSGMRTLVETIQCKSDHCDSSQQDSFHFEIIPAESPRPRSPHMNNEEPIEMSHFPDGRPGEKEGTVRPIERDDFPAPQFLYADEARRRRWSEPMKKEEDGELENQQ